MMRVPSILATGLAVAIIPVLAAAETLVVSRTIRAAEVISARDVTLVAGVTPGALSDPSEAIGLETRVTLYAGRPVRAADLGPAALVERNQIVLLVFREAGLDITTEGRALGRGGMGEVIRVMNLVSRSTVSGRIGAGGAVHVAGSSMPLN